LAIKSIIGATCLYIIFLSVNAKAAYVELNSGGSSFIASGGGAGRAIGFQADSDFSIDSVGIHGSLIAQSFDVVIYNSIDGNQVNGILANASDTLEGDGSSNNIVWNDIAIDYSFTAGNYYVINWRRSDGSSNSFGTLQYFYDNDLPVTLGPVTLINGASGFNAENANTLHPNLRVNISTVPIPTAVWLFGSGLIGLIGVARRKHCY
jgi:hypothetical protein